MSFLKALVGTGEAFEEASEEEILTVEEEKVSEAEALAEPLLETSDKVG